MSIEWFHSVVVFQPLGFNQQCLLDPPITTIPMNFHNIIALTTSIAMCSSAQTWSRLELLLGMIALHLYFLMPMISFSYMDKTETYSPL